MFPCLPTYTYRSLFLLLIRSIVDKYNLTQIFDTRIFHISVDGTILLIEESTQMHIPTHLETLFELLEPKRPTRNDILAIIVYAICVESGFCICADDLDYSKFAAGWSFSYHLKFVRKCAQKLPIDFQNYENSSIEFRLQLYGYSSRPCLLLVREIGDVACITFSLEHRSGKSVCLPISRYIIHQQVRMGAKCLKNTKELAFIVRDRLVVPIRNLALDADDYPYAGLLGVPEIIRHIIFGFLNKATLQKVSHTCTELRAEILNKVQNMK